MSCSVPTKRSQVGLTLLEVMVAMAVFAYAAVAITSSSADHLNSQGYLKQKTLATWVASDTLARVRLARENNGKYQKNGEAEQAGEVFFWRVKEEKTSMQQLIAVTVEVRDNPDSSNILSTLTTYMKAKQQS